MKPRTLRKSALAAAAAPGLTRFDRDRAASLADEGGASAANVESQDKAAQARAEARTSSGGKSVERTEAAE